jgi:TrmH family RNA methyltransferase
MLSKATIKDIQSLQHKKFRDETHTFLAEGPKVVHELLQESAFECVAIYGLKDWVEKAIQESTEFEKYMHIVSEIELSKLATYTTPNKVVAVFKKVTVVSNIDLRNNITLVLDDIQDPGNLGTIIRTADWFGVKNIVCSLKTADAYNSKVVQSTMASLARVNILYTDHIDWVKKNRSVKVLATLLQGNALKNYKGLDEGILLIGNEANGLCEELQQLADEKITIPGFGKAESLNAAIATAIVLYELKNS